MYTAVLVFGAALALAIAAFVCFTILVNARSERQESQVQIGDWSESSRSFLRALGGAAGEITAEGNSVKLRQNGDEIFPMLLDAIAEATSSVHLATFTYEHGRIPNEFGAALGAAARRGVEVRLLLDRNGSKKMSPELRNGLDAEGCDVRWFRKADLLDWTRYNRRMHTKLLIVDGIRGFTGGVGIADEWSGNGDGPGHWRDTHIELRGPAVAALQAAFVENWNEATGELPTDLKYFPMLEFEGDTAVCCVQSNPSNSTSAAQRAMAALVAGAARSLYITNAYFVPTGPFIRLLCAARARGVDVNVLVPGPYHNKPAVRRASRQTWRPLLSAGVQIWEHQRTMVHAKVVVVDERIVAVGSINFDPRSFTLNAECSAVFASEDLARQASQAFHNDLLNSRRVTVSDLDQRSVWNKGMDGMCHWLRAQL